MRFWLGDNEDSEPKSQRGLPLVVLIFQWIKLMQGSSRLCSTSSLLSLCAPDFKSFPVTSLVVQWLRLCTSNAEGMGSVLGWETKIPHAAALPKGKKKSSHPTEVVIVFLLWLGTLWDSQSRMPHWLVTRSDKLSSFTFTQISACPLLTPSSVTHLWFGFVFTCNSNKHLSHSKI